jgi:tRNA G18 (ribose-2'-O)-methylase SpoU
MLQDNVRLVYPTAEILVVKPSTWKGVLRNVPSSTSAATTTTCEGDFVAVSFHNDLGTVGSSTSVKGPILVLVGLQYRGNVGTIIRTAVQSDMWEKICLVDVVPTVVQVAIKDAEDAEDVKHTEEAKRNKKNSSDSQKKEQKKVWDQNNKKKLVTNEDVVYYSLCNAPLINIERFKSEEEFLEHARHAGRAIVGVDGGTTVYGSPRNLLDPTSWDIVKNNQTFIVLGSETHGLSDAFLDVCDHLVTLPCLSASINVSCCFAAVDTLLKVARIN